MADLASHHPDTRTRLQTRLENTGHHLRQPAPASVNQPHRILGLPHGVDRVCIPDDAIACAAHELPDVIVLTEPGAASLIASRVPFGCGAILPVIDAAPRDGQFGRPRARRFDMISGNNPGELADSLTMLAPVIERLRGLPTSVRTSSDPRMALLARIAVRDRGIVPRRDAAVLDTFVYADDSAVPGMLGHAEDLAEHGLLDRQFFDTLITCPRCASARLSVRERCASCLSSNLVEESILHHLRCTYQAPEHEFLDDNGFGCPKCRAPLVHFGVDYDRPGSVSLCRACGHASGETSVGFVCLDCEGESGADDMGSRTIQRYDISDAGREQLRHGNALRPAGHHGETATHRVRSFAQRETQAQRPYCILSVQMAAPRGRSVGRLHTQVRALFASAMRETFSDGTETIADAPHFLALLSGDAKADVERALPDIRLSLERHLTSSPRIDYRVYGPDDVQNLLDTTLAH